MGIFASFLDTMNLGRKLILTASEEKVRRIQPHLVMPNGDPTETRHSISGLVVAFPACMPQNAYICG